MYVEHIKVCIYTTMQTDVVGRIQVGRYHYVPVDIEQYMIPGIIYMLAHVRTSRYEDNHVEVVAFGIGNTAEKGNLNVDTLL